MSGCTLPPFALSLSKPVLSDCCEQAVEGGFSSVGFDRLSPNGFGVS